MEQQDAVIWAVIEQIRSDVNDCTTDPLFSLLMSVPTDQLVAFLPQETQQYLAG
jgi:hypothetical protein